MEVRVLYLVGLVSDSKQKEVISTEKVVAGVTAPVQALAVTW